MSDELRLAGLLCSRLCHDLVGPVSAMSNGIEFLEDDAPEMREEVARLLAMSSEQASHRLQFFRIAFGRTESSSVAPAVAARATVEFLRDHKIECRWNTPAENAETDTERAAVKLIVNMILLASECLMRGGTIDVSAELAGEALEIRVLADGPTVGFSEDQRRALELGNGEGGAETYAELQPRHIVPFLAARLARDGGGPLAWGEPDTPPFALTARFTPIRGR